MNEHEKRAKEFSRFSDLEKLQTKLNGNLAGENDRYLNDCHEKSPNQYTVEKDIHVKFGDKVNAFSVSYDTLGTLILKYSSQEEMLDNMERDIRAVVD
ncbi:hypothetical protein [Alcanivorax sp.]|uniref:hypothetical protein n=1 Tax=Alcanivorax sp. TaxID=1872427 RepID=UPI0025B997BA|nr:hypothetical protein [Alcanivorax sp.]